MRRKGSDPDVLMERPPTPNRLAFQWHASNINKSDHAFRLETNRESDKLFFWNKFKNREISFEIFDRSQFSSPSSGLRGRQREENTRGAEEKEESDEKARTQIRGEKGLERRVDIPGSFSHARARDHVDGTRPRLAIAQKSFAWQWATTACHVVQLVVRKKKEKKKHGDSVKNLWEKQTAQIGERNSITIVPVASASL